MLGVPLAEADVQPYLNDQLSLAVVNTPTSCVIAGTPEAIAELQARLEAQGLKPRALHTSHAFHSAMMDPVLPAFREQARRVRLNPPTQPYLSNVTGTWITASVIATLRLAKR